MSKQKILGVAVAVILILAWWSCYHGSSSGQSQVSTGGRSGAGAGGVVPVVAGKAEEKDMPSYLDGLGTVRAGRESVNTHLVFSALCVRGDVVIASAPSNEVAQILARLTGNSYRGDFNNSLVFLLFIDKATYDAIPKNGGVVMPLS
jgi:multidrug efflux system membrane fusion protein